MDNPDLPITASPRPRFPVRPTLSRYLTVAPRLGALRGGNPLVGWPDPGSGAGSSGKQESKPEASPGDSPQNTDHEPESRELPLVLLVEDNPTNAIPAFDYLMAKGYRVIHAHDGYEALAQAAVLHPRIILMDIMMPRMDGLEATRRLRAHPDAQVASTPIIVVTARAMQGDREACLEAGADEYMAKPISLKALLVNIEALLQAPRT